MAALNCVALLVQEETAQNPEVKNKSNRIKKRKNILHKATHKAFEKSLLPLDQKEKSHKNLMFKTVTSSRLKGFILLLFLNLPLKQVTD